MTKAPPAEDIKRKEHDDLLESEHRLSDIIDFLPDATFAIDEKGVVIAWNHAIEEMTGVPAEEMIGQGEYAYAIPFYGERRPMLIDLAFKDDLELRSRYALLKEMPGAIEAETRFARPRGEDRTLWARVSSLYNRNGEYTGAIETIRDITEQKRSEALLKESEIRYRRLFEAAKDGILILDVGDGTIIDANPFILEMLGYRLDEILGRTLPEIGLISDTKLAEEAFLRLKEEGYIRYEDLPLETKDGRLMEVEFVSNRYAINNHSVIQCNIRDITKRKHAEAALRSSEHLQQLILSAVPDILIRCDAEGRYLDILTPEDDRFMLPKEEIIGKTVTEVTSEAIGEKIIQAIALALETGEMQTVEYALSVPAGHRHFEARIVPYADDEVIVLIRDITDRKEAEDALHQKNEELATAEEELRSQLDELVSTQQQVRESEEYIRTVLDNLPIGVAVNSFDPEVNFEYFNENFFQIYRTTAEALSGKDSFWEVVYQDPVLRRELKERVVADVASGDPGRMHWEDIPITRKGEKTTYISAMNIPVPGRDLVISTVWDVTNRVEAEGEIKHRLAFERVISGISSRFVTESDIDVAINKALGDIGAFCGASRSYVFLFDPSGGEMSNTHEWCDDGVTPEIENLQKQPTDLFPWWMERLRNGESIRIQSLDDLPPEAVAEKEILEPQGVTSLIVLPLLIRSNMAGFIGFDNVAETKDWTEEDLHLLRITSELFGTAFERKLAEDRILLHIRRTEALLELHRMAGATEQELMDYALNASPLMTDSRYAFIGLMNDDESVMTVHAWSEGVMESCSVGGTPIQYPIESAGVWGECVRTRTPTIINDYAASHPAKHGLPEGHLPITRYLGVPILHGNRIVAILAVANKEDEYLDDDVSALVTLGNLMGELIFRERAEAALQKSEERYRSVSTLITDFAYSCLKEDVGTYQIDWIAGAIEQITGYEIDEVIAEGCWGFMIHPDDWNIFEENVLLLPRGESSECDLRIIRKDGKIRWLSAETRCIRDETGRSRIYGGCRDITEGKTARIELELNQARLESAMEAGGIAWWEMDCLTGNVAFSPRKAEMLGYSPDQFSYYTDFTDLLHPDDHEMAMQAMRDHLEGRKQRYEVEYRIKHSAGTYLWFRDIGSVTEWNRDGAPLKVVGLVVNITVLKEAEMALRESEALLSTAGRMTHFGGWSVDLARQRVSWSDEVARVHGMEPGYSPSVDEGISFYAPEWREKITEVFSACARDGTPYDEEMEIITAGGERRWVRTVGEAVRDRSGHIIRVQGAFQDITRRKLAEEERKKAYALIEENMLKFSALNDQIRNPLTVIMALADLEGGEYSEKIMQQVRAIDQIITLLDRGVLELESTRMFMKRHDQISG